jgi:hypothetical protein
MTTDTDETRCPGSRMVQTWRTRKLAPSHVTCEVCGARWALEDTAGQPTWAMIPDHARGEA